MTELSIGELDALVFKAYRGAGFSWGLSQEAGRAAAWMAMCGLPAAGSFAELLYQTNGIEHSTLTPVMADGNWRSSAGSGCCPVITGTMLSDFGWTQGRKLTLSAVYVPLILAPFVSVCAASAGTALCVSSGDVSIVLMANGRLACPGDVGFVSQETIVVSEWQSSNSEIDDTAPLVRRAAISDVAMERLETLAHRTYVPATELSRSGAGAGLTDND